MVKDRILPPVLRVLCGDTKLEISRRALEMIVAHARAEAPRECCGLLVGKPCSVSEAVAARNIAAVATRFQIDPQDHLDALRAARRRGVEILGFYHSHTHTAARPSETDRAEAGYPDHLYLIVSLAVEPADARLFRLIAGNFREVGFVTID
jgi:[CysO sulfur-carrier protein]-S-L-cysteine hydrolase